MIFAFAASTSLFHASLRWESEGANLRRAALVAERALEELRATSAAVPSGSSFADVLAPLLGDRPEFPESPGFAINLTLLDNVHRLVPTSGVIPDPGVHSPCSTFFTNPPTLATNPPNGNPQRNNRYGTYVYTRAMSSSLALVQVTVTYGNGGKNFRLISLVGDPITPMDNSLNDNVVVTRVSGSSTLNDFTSTSEYTAQVVTASGSRPRDVTILWGIAPDSTGSLVILPLDSTGRSCRVSRRSVTPVGANARARLVAKVRYGGQETGGFSEVINLP